MCLNTVWVEVVTEAAAGCSKHQLTVVLWQQPINYAYPGQPNWAGTRINIHSLTAYV